MERDAVVEDGMKRGKVGEFVGDKFGDVKGHVMDLFLPQVSRWDENLSFIRACGLEVPQYSPGNRI
jgi:hypothetical protein